MKAAKPHSKPLVPSWDLVGPSWQLLLKYFEPVIFLFLLPSLVLVLGSLLLGDTRHIHHVSELSRRQRYGAGLLALGFIWSLINYAPALYFRLQATAGKEVRVIACYQKGLRFFWRVIGLNLLIGITIILGLVLLIVPGLVFIYFYVKRYYLAAYYLVDRDLDIMPALRSSHEETSDYEKNIWGLIGVQVCFSLLAGIVSSLTKIGVIPAILIQLVVLFLPALRYREIKAAQRGAR